MSENNTENFYFKLKSIDAYDLDLYIEYISDTKSCHIGTTDGVYQYYRYMTNSELIEFSNALKHVIKMGEDRLMEYLVQVLVNVSEYVTISRFSTYEEAQKFIDENCDTNKADFIIAERRIY